MALKGEPDPVLSVGNIELNRDFGSVFDLINMFVQVVESSDKMPAFGVFNVCSGTAKNLKKILETLAKHLDITNLQFEVDANRVRSNEPETIVGNNDLLSGILNWKPSCKSEFDLIDNFLRDV